MADQDDVRRIALSLPGAIEEKGHFAFAVANKGKEKGFVWSWLERIHPKKARVPRGDVLAVRVASLTEKELLLASDDAAFFTEPHYNGYPAVLVRLPEIEASRLEQIITEAWRCTAPRALVEELERRPAVRAPRPSSPRRRAKPSRKPKPAR
jgi:hypothetical protein